MDGERDREAVASPPRGGVPGRRPHHVAAVAARLSWWMAVWALPALAWSALRLDGRACATLTLTLALSIVHVRSLQAQVSRLDPEVPLRAGVVAFLRWGLLLVGLIGVLSFGVSRPLALAWGISLLPAALITEAVVDALASRS
ncbi:MAG TPA: hypothetical protein VMT85_13605 [Thermoanaerobaculia bacterium]|nr:hypothetical protein [Thermoanaerobaculia bacterium]